MKTQVTGLFYVASEPLRICGRIIVTQQIPTEQSPSKFRNLPLQQWCHSLCFST